VVLYLGPAGESRADDMAETVVGDGGRHMGILSQKVRVSIVLTIGILPRSDLGKIRRPTNSCSKKRSCYRSINVEFNRIFDNELSVYLVDYKNINF
jgi:hypothetical protein